MLLMFVVYLSKETGLGWISGILSRVGLVVLSSHVEGTLYPRTDYNAIIRELKLLQGRLLSAAR